MAPGRGRLVFRIGALIFALWSLFFILRTSFYAGGSRVFCLWDDAMVSMRFARNLATGHGLVWNPGGERVQGFSNLGITLLMAVIHLLPLGATRVSLVFQLFNLGLLLYCAHLVRAIAVRLFESEAAGLAAAFVLMLSGPIAVLTLQGTDVGVITTILLAALHEVVKATDRGGAWPSRVYAILALGILTRLDFVFLYAVFALVSLAFPRPRSSLLAAAGVFAGTTGAILAFQALYYGDPLPNTYYLKATGSPLRLMLQSGLDSQIDFFTRALAPVVLSGLGLALVQPKDRRLWLLFAVPAVLLAYDMRYGGDWVYRWTSRFFAPAFPFLILLAVGAGARLFERLRVADTTEDGEVVMRPLSPFQRHLGLAFFAIMALVAVNTTPAFKEWLDPREEILLSSMNVKNYRFARYFSWHTRPDATIAVAMAGTLPYFLDRYTIDVLGKCDSHIARMSVPRFIAGHSKWDWPYVLHERRPDIIDRVSRGLVLREDFIALYDEADAAGLDPFFVRKESRHKIDDPTVHYVKPHETTAHPIDGRLVQASP
ncbi:MAG: hypothetical protein U0359_05775 [Byssovorax sp.]